MGLPLPLLLGAAAAVSQAPVDPAATWPDVAWNHRHAIAADLDGDGRKDWLALGLTDETLVVGLWRAGADAPDRLEFDRAGMRCSLALFTEDCPGPEPLLAARTLTGTVERELAQWLGVPADGRFLLDQGAQAVVMPAGHAGPVWFYWSAPENRFTSMRIKGR